jgi:hypothetical protein
MNLKQYQGNPDAMKESIYSTSNAFPRGPSMRGKKHADLDPRT